MKPTSDPILHKNARDSNREPKTRSHAFSKNRLKESSQRIVHQPTFQNPRRRFFSRLRLSTRDSRDVRRKERAREKVKKRRKIGATVGVDRNGNGKGKEVNQRAKVGKSIKKDRRGNVGLKSGGHGTRTRNPVKGTSFPMRPLAIRLSSKQGTPLL